ncbi:hypothetical protein HY992_00045 [Candidatus Micrarchaeota archaeon]|nr:hypothetical protein [Candidatus Micrarchaeota archaeon]
MRKVVCFGNELLEEDRLALDVGKALQKEMRCFEFFFARNPEALLNYEKEKQIFILDVVRGINCVRFVEVDELKGRSIFSGHDYDLGTFLLLSRMKNVKIIGLPSGMKLREAKKQAKQLLEKE